MTSVAIIIAALAVDHRLHEAIESVSTDPAISCEIVVVIDGSADPAQVAALDAHDARVLFTGRTRSGAAVAANVGIAATDSEYVARLDADDRWRPGKLAAQIDYLRTHPEVVGLGTEGVLIDNQSREVGTYPTSATLRANRMLMTRNPFIHSSLLLRRASLLEIGSYDPSCIRMQDYDLLLRLAMLGDLAILQGPHVEYRIHDGQTSSRREGFGRLMRTIIRRRRALARAEGESALRQSVRDSVYVAAQYARYAGWRQPRYATQAVVVPE